VGTFSVDIYNRPKLVYTCLGDIEVVTPTERNGKCPQMGGLKEF